jgi:hypothetical protein
MQDSDIHPDAESPSTIDAGWQTRMNDALKDWLRTHSPHSSA